MNLEARPQFARTIIAGYIGGTLLVDGVADVTAGNRLGWLWLTLGTVAFLLLPQHLREQALRGLTRPGATWARTDTANVSILGVLIALMVVDILAGPSPLAEDAATYVLAAVYLTLAADFTIQRRRTVRASLALRRDEGVRA